MANSDRGPADKIASAGNPITTAGKRKRLEHTLSGISFKFRRRKASPHGLHLLYSLSLSLFHLQTAFKGRIRMILLLLRVKGITNIRNVAISSHVDNIFTERTKNGRNDNNNNFFFNKNRRNYANSTWNFSIANGETRGILWPVSAVVVRNLGAR